MPSREGNPEWDPIVRPCLPARAKEQPLQAGLLAPGSSPLPAFPKKGLSPFQWHLEHWLTGHSCGNSAGFEPASLFTPASRGTCNAAWVGAKPRAVNPRLHSQGRALNARRPSPCPIGGQPYIQDNRSRRGRRAVRVVRPDRRSCPQLYQAQPADAPQRSAPWELPKE
ncbi:MAG: hypothetical protein RJB02_541 [Pseudomonadota bacterium]